MAGPRREVKLPYREINIGCPHCRAPLIVGTVMETISLSRRSCTKCLEKKASVLRRFELLPS